MGPAFLYGSGAFPFRFPIHIKKDFPTLGKNYSVKGEWFLSRIRSYYFDERAEELRLKRVFSSILAFWALSGLVLFFYPDRGEFGDMFGSVNTLFSGLAFGGIIYTIFQQKIELKLQREELKLQRQEVEKTNQELAKQVEAMNSQRFESTFFNMLSLHHQITNGLTIKPFGFNRLPNQNGLGNHNLSNEVTGRAVFEQIYHNLKNASSSSLNEIGRRVIKPKYLIMNQYFRNLIEIVDLIRFSTFLTSEEKIRYTRTVASQLSPAECVVIFYYILWEGSSDEYLILSVLIKDYSELIPTPHIDYYYELMTDIEKIII